MKFKDALPTYWEYAWIDYGDNNSMAATIYSAKQKWQSVSWNTWNL